LIDAGIDICYIRKKWDLHVKKVLNISLNDNLTIVEETVSYLKITEKVCNF
jgi:isopropylmalate/homocitrate/citramalate synthase